MNLFDYLQSRKIPDAPHRETIGDPNDLGPFSSLTDRQWEAVWYDAQGMVAKTIAAVMGVKPSTVVSHLRDASKRLGPATTEDRRLALHAVIGKWPHRQQPLF